MNKGAKRWPLADNLTPSEKAAILNGVIDSAQWISPVLNPVCGQVEPPTAFKLSGLPAYSDGTNWDPIGDGLPHFVFWNGSAWVQLDNASGYVNPNPVAWAIVASNRTTTGQSLVAITDLSLPLNANTVYEVVASLMVGSSSTAGNQYGIQFSAAGATINGTFHRADAFSADAGYHVIHKVLAFHTVTDATPLENATNRGVLFKAIVTVGANAGNLTVEHLKVTSGTATCYAGSFLKATVISGSPSGAAQYTNEDAQDAVGAMIGPSLQYVDATPLLDVIQDVRTTASPTFVGATAVNDFTLTCGTDKTLVFTKTTWKDVFFPMSPPKATGAGNPSLVTWNGNIRGYAFAINDTHDFDPQEFPHDGKQGGVGSWHVHWVSRTNVAAQRFVKWQIEYSQANTDAVFPGATTISAEKTIPVSTTALTHYLTVIDTFTTSNIAGMMTCKLTRIAASGTAPASDPVVLAVHYHYEVDTPGGSRTISTK